MLDQFLHGGSILHLTQSLPPRGVPQGGAPGTMRLIYEQLLPLRQGFLGQYRKGGGVVEQAIGKGGLIKTLSNY